MRRETSRPVTMSRRRLCGASGCGAWSANGNSGGPRPKAFGIVIYSEGRPERGSFVDGGNL